MFSLQYKRFKLLSPGWLVDPFFRLPACGSILYSRGYPLSVDANKRASPFFIVGSGRSGNTLLRSMLCSNPTIGIPPENGGFRQVYRKYENFSHFPWRALVGVVLAEMEVVPSFENWRIDIGSVQNYLNTIPKEERSFASIIHQIYTKYLEENFPGRSIWGDKTPVNSFNLSIGLRV